MKMEENILIVDEEGAITLPQHALNHMDVCKGDTVLFYENTEGNIILRKDNEHLRIRTDLLNKLQDLIDRGEVKEKTVEELLERIVVEHCTKYLKKHN